MRSLLEDRARAFKRRINPFSGVYAECIRGRRRGLTSGAGFPARRTRDDVRFGEIGGCGLVRGQRREQLCVGQLQAAVGHVECNLVAYPGGEQRTARGLASFPGRSTENVRVQGDGAHGRIQAVPSRRRADGPLAGILAVTGGDLDVVPRLPGGRRPIAGWRGCAIFRMSRPACRSARTLCRGTGIAVARMTTALAFGLCSADPFGYPG